VESIGLFQEVRLHAEPAGAKGKVHVLEVDEIALVKAAERLEEVSTHEEEGTDHLLYRLTVKQLRRRQMVAWEEPRQQPVEPRDLTDEHSERRKPRTGEGWITLCVEQLNSADPYVPSLFTTHEICNPPQRVGKQAGIGIEKQDVVCAASSGALIAGSCEARVAIVVNNLEWKRKSIEAFCRTVSGRVVDYGYPRDCRRR
jgi:hypothetical protein